MNQNETQAKALLEQIIAQNTAQQYPGIDRSSAAIEKRRTRMRLASDPKSQFGGKSQGFGADLEQHVINGDLTSNQAVDVLMVLYGLK